MRIESRLVLAAAIGLAPGAGPLAEESTPAAGAEIDEIVVTASRRELTAERINFATAGLDVDAIAVAPLLTDAFAALPGVALQQTTPGQGAAIVRGQRGSSVLHLVDGIRVNNAIFRSAPTQYFALLPVVSAERLEVVRGTPTSLYGSDAVGGVVQLVTHRPDFNDERTVSRGLVELAADSAEQRRGVRARLDVGRRGIAASVSGEYVALGDRRIGGGDRIAPTDVVTRAVRTWVGLAPDERQRVSIDLQFAEQPSTPRIDELVPGFEQSAAASDEFFFEPNRRSFAHVRYERDDALAGGDLTASLAWQRIDDDRRTRDTGAETRRLEANRSDLAGLTLALADTTADGSWVAGFEHYVDTVSSSRKDVDLLTGTVTAAAPRFPDGAELIQTALYASGERLLAARHRFSGGVRVSHVEIDIPDGEAVDAKTLSITDPSGDLGYLFSATSSIDVVVNVGAGFRAPNVFDLGTIGERPGNRFNEPNTALESESVTSVDVGLRWRGDRLRGEVMLYRLDYRDRIVSVPTGEITDSGRTVVRAENVAEVTVDGVEAALDWRLNDAWSLAASAFFTVAEQTTAEGADEPGDRIPPLEARLALRYAPFQRWYVEITANAADGQDRLSARDAGDPRIDPAGTAGWAVFDATYVYRAAAGWQVRAAVTNLGDRQYRRHGSGIDAPGRNFSVTCRYAW